MSITFTTVPAKSLYQPLLSTDVTFKLADITGFSGSNLTAADFGTVGYGVLLNSDRSVMELFSWDPTTIASTSISFVARGLPFTGSGASVTAYKLDWPAGSTVLLGSDTPQFIQWLKDYIDGIAIAGSPDASTTAKGIVEEATQTEVDAGTAAGSTAARLFQNPSTIRAKKYHDAVASATGTDAYAITITPAITAYATYQEFTFKADVANTGACTLNVSGLGAKTIKKDVSSDLVTGDILAGQTVKVMYDGTNMQLVSKSSLGVAKNATVEVFTADGTYTMPANAKLLEVICIGAGGAGSDGGVKPTNGTQYPGSSGGGGGARITQIFPADGLTSTVTVTVAATTTANNAGGSSTFGSYLTAFGGGVGGGIGSSTSPTGAGGGGSLGVGANSATSGSVLGGAPALTSGAAGFAGQGAGGNSAADGTYAEWGGASGGGAVQSGDGKKGGSSRYGGGGGGGGGGINGATPGTPAAGAEGGVSLSITTGGGGAGGAVATSGTAGTSRSGTGFCGDGGGGGGANSTGTAGSGGAGGAPGGGGGGGGSNALGTTAGTGGTGGRGEVIVITYF